MNPKARRKARKFALQALYEWQLSQNDITSIEQHFLNDYVFKNTDIPYFKNMIHGVTQHLEAIDQHMLPHLDRPVAQLNAIELCILRMAIYELSHELSVPTSVILNEAVELAKLFGATDGFKYVNGVLDKVAATIRPSKDED